jgi:hypothetical protein
MVAELAVGGTVPTGSTCSPGPGYWGSTPWTSVGAHCLSDFSLVRGPLCLVVHGEIYFPVQGGARLVQIPVKVVPVLPERISLKDDSVDASP